MISRSTTFPILKYAMNWLNVLTNIYKIYHNKGRFYTCLKNKTKKF